MFDYFIWKSCIYGRYLVAMHLFCPFMNLVVLLNDISSLLWYLNLLVGKNFFYKYIDILVLLLWKIFISTVNSYEWYILLAERDPWIVVRKHVLYKFSHMRWQFLQKLSTYLQYIPHLYIYMSIIHIFYAITTHVQFQC